MAVQFETQAEYLTAVYAANDREREAWFAARNQFVDAAGRFLRSRHAYWSQVEDAGDSAARDQVRDELNLITDQLTYDISSAYAFGPKMNYLTGEDQTD
jgi:hypothetical protein